MATLRHEIPFVTTTVDATTYISFDKVTITPANYNGSCSWYWELIAEGTGTVYLRDSSDNVLGSLDFTGPEERKRSTSIEILSTKTLHFYNTSSVTVYRSRLICIQDTGQDIVASETQYLLASYATSASVTPAPATTPKYWTYNSANWDGTISVYMEASINSNNKSGVGYVQFQEDDEAFGTWTNIGSPISVTGLVASNVRSGALTVTNGKHYRAVFYVGNAMYTSTFYGVRIVIKSVAGWTDKDESAGFSAYIPIYGGTGTNEMAGQSVPAQSSYILKRLRINLEKVGSPTDILRIEIASDSFSGTTLSTIDIDGSTMSASQASRYLVLPTPLNIASGTTYYLRLSRTGARNTSNYYRVYDKMAGYVGDESIKNSGVWTDNTARTLDFSFQELTTPITKLEEYYQFITNSDSDRFIQRDFQLWDPSEWSGVTNIYKPSHCATNSADSGHIYDASVGTRYHEVGGTVSLYGPTGTQEKIGQSFQVATTDTYDSIALYLYKTSTPSDNLTIKVYSGSIEGTLVGTSDTVSSVSVGSYLLASKTFNFSTPLSLATGTTYWLVLERAGARSEVNYVGPVYVASSTYANGQYYQCDNGSWTADSTKDLRFAVYKNITGSVTGANQQIYSTGITMPTSSCEIDWITDISTGSISGSRLIVCIVKSEEGPTLNLKVNIGGVWKIVTGVSVNIGGVWKAATAVSSNIGGTWKT